MRPRRTELQLVDATRQARRSGFVLERERGRHDQLLRTIHDGASLPTLVNELWSARSELGWP